MKNWSQTSNQNNYSRFLFLAAASVPTSFVEKFQTLPCGNKVSQLHRSAAVWSACSLKASTLFFVMQKDFKFKKNDCQCSHERARQKYFPTFVDFLFIYFFCYWTSKKYPTELLRKQKSFDQSDPGKNALKWVVVEGRLTLVFAN